MKKLKAPIDFLSHHLAVHHYLSYLATIGERAGSYPPKHYTDDYVTVIRQTKTEIIVKIIK